MTGGADLSINSEQLRPVEAAARTLYEDLPAAAFTAEPESTAIGRYLDSLHYASGPALLLLTDRWRTKTLALQHECARISGHLDSTVVVHAGLEHELRSDFQRAQALLATTGNAGNAVTPLAATGHEPDGQTEHTALNRRITDA